jgi:hypothetical protein
LIGRVKPTGAQAVTDKQLTKYHMVIVDEGHHIVATDPVKWGTPDTLRPTLNTLAKTDLLPTPLTTGFPLVRLLRKSSVQFVAFWTSAALALHNKVRVALYGPALVPRKPDALTGLMVVQRDKLIHARKPDSLEIVVWPNNEKSAIGSSHELIRGDVWQAVHCAQALEAFRFSRADTLIHLAEKVATVELAPL